MCRDDEIITDIRKIAAKLNTSELSFDEYIIAGGRFENEITADDYNSFANFCELAGVKTKIK